MALNQEEFAICVGCYAANRFQHTINERKAHIGHFVLTLSMFKAEFIPKEQMEEQITALSEMKQSILDRVGKHIERLIA
jgi:hypothetical protein